MLRNIVLQHRNEKERLISLPYVERESIPLARKFLDSDANLLSGELATALTGRYISIEVFPFSFSEFLKAKGFDDSMTYQPILSLISLLHLAIQSLEICWGLEAQTR